MKNSSKWIQYLGFIAIGVIGNVIGPLLPAIRTDISINYSQGGMLLSGQFIGMLLTSLVGGYLMDKWGKKPFLLAGSSMLVIGLIGCMAARNYVMLYVLNLITGFGYGIYEVGINALCADSSEDNKGSDMSFLHFFFGVGAILAPVLAMFSVEYLGSWRYSFAIPLAAPVIIIAFIATSKLEKQVQSKEASVQTAAAEVNPYRSLFLWAAGLSAFFYVGVEVSTGGWITTYISTAVPDSLLPASIATTLFWAALTIGRLFAGRIADRMGLSRYACSAALATFLAALAWSILPSGNWVLVVLMLLGALLSGQFPTFMAMATAHFPGRTGTTAAFLTLFSGLGGFILPTLIGRVADLYGIEVLPYSIAALSALLALFTFIAKKQS